MVGEEERVPDGCEHAGSVKTGKQINHAQEIEEMVEVREGWIFGIKNALLEFRSLKLLRQNSKRPQEPLSDLLAQIPKFRKAY